MYRHRLQACTDPSKDVPYDVDVVVACCLLRVKLATLDLNGGVAMHPSEPKYMHTTKDKLIRARPGQMGKFVENRSW